MVESQAVFSVLNKTAAALGGWTALQSIKRVHLDSEGQDWEPWQAYDIGGTVDVSTFRIATDLDLAAGASRVEMDAAVVYPWPHRVAYIEITDTEAGMLADLNLGCGRYQTAPPKPLSNGTPGSMQALIRYHWPGNIRELQNVIERAVIISRGPVLNVALAELTPDVSSPPVPIVTSAKSASHESLQEMLEETERNQILRALEDANGVVAGPNGAAARLGVKRSTLPTQDAEAWNPALANCR
jgi:hypothetical protein